MLQLVSDLLLMFLLLLLLSLLLPLLGVTVHHLMRLLNDVAKIKSLLHSVHAK